MFFYAFCVNKVYYITCIPGLLCSDVKWILAYWMGLIVDIVNNMGRNFKYCYIDKSNI